MWTTTATQNGLFTTTHYLCTISKKTFKHLVLSVQCFLAYPAPCYSNEFQSRSRFVKFDLNQCFTINMSYLLLITKQAVYSYVITKRKLNLMLKLIVLQLNKYKNIKPRLTPNIKYLIAMKLDCTLECDQDIP